MHKRIEHNGKKVFSSFDNGKQDEVSRVILELQKERFFEDLTAKYWNNSIKGACIRHDDSEGITLESLGGVFIATLVGLSEYDNKCFI